MKKIIFIALILLTSCASRKTTTNKVDIKKDSISETKVITKLTENKNNTDTTSIKKIETNDEIVIIPIDPNKNIYINNVPYKNVVLKIKKNKSNTLYTNKKIASETRVKDSLGSNKVKTSGKFSEKQKKIDKKPDYYILLWVLFLILIIYLLWRSKRWLLNIL
jgi:ATP-dependent Zn protease